MMSFITGLTVGLSLIMVIGTQNVYLIKQGALRRHSLLCAFICSFCDALLILLGVIGAHQLTKQLPVLNKFLLVVGFIFLVVYGSLSLYRGIKGKLPTKFDGESQSGRVNTWKIVAIALGFSLLNPHAFIDAFVILGGMASNLQPLPRWEFAIGAVSASFIWFFALTFTAMYASAILRRQRVWQCLEIFSGVLMIYIALHFVLNRAAV